MKNRGFDAAIDYGKRINKDFSLQFRGSFTFARNQVLEYDEAPGLRPALRRVGRRLNTYMGYVANGLYIDQADIANNPKSTLGNITIAPGDKNMWISPMPTESTTDRLRRTTGLRSAIPISPKLFTALALP